MKNFTLNFIMTLVVMMGMALNVNAAPLYETLEEAQAALDEGVVKAGKLSSQAMDPAVAEVLKEAKIDATAVWDSGLRDDINEIERVMPVLNDAMAKAEASIAEYKPLNEAVDGYEQNLLTKISDMAFDLEMEYDGTEMWTNLSEAFEVYKTYLYNTLCELKGKADADMLAAAQGGSFDVDAYLAKEDIELLSIDEVVDRVLKGETIDNIITGISSVVVAPVNSNAAYSLNGNKVSENYKGIVIKGGKKYVVK